MLAYSTSARKAPNQPEIYDSSRGEHVVWKTDWAEDAKDDGES